MSKKLTGLAAGLTAAMVLMTGCSGQTAETTAAAAGQETETVKESETSTQAIEPETESAGEGTEDSTEESTENMQGSMDDLSVPLKIWGEIMEVSEGTLYVDNQSENSSKGEIILNIDPERTLILDGENGFPVEYQDIEIGRFEAYLGPAMTMSLPPQSTPDMVIVNIPEDGFAAQYVIAAGEVEEKDGVKTLTGKDGTEYTLDDEVSIIPYLTRQMVQLEDIGRNSRCLVWLGEEETVERIVLFNESF